MWFFNVIMNGIKALFVRLSAILTFSGIIDIDQAPIVKGRDICMSFMTLMLIVALIGAGYSLRTSQGRLVLTNEESENEILDAEIV